MPEGEIERRRLEPPLPIAGLAVGEGGEGVDRVVAGEVRERVERECELQLAVVAHVLADALVPGAV